MESFKVWWKKQGEEQRIQYNPFCVKAVKDRYILLQVWTKFLNETQNSKTLPVGGDPGG